MELELGSRIFHQLELPKAGIKHGGGLGLCLIVAVLPKQPFREAPGLLSEVVNFFGDSLSDPVDFEKLDELEDVAHDEPPGLNAVK